MRKAVGIIPARYHSTRFPGKPLAKIFGKSMIELVYQKANQARLLDEVIVATDHPLIKEEVERFNGKLRLTSPHHQSGTERVAEVVREINSDIILNIQGDEPLIDPTLLDDLVKVLQDENIPMATLIEKERDLSLINNPNIVKVVIDKNDYAIYFSRSPVPFQAQNFFYRHIGIYGFQKNFLLEFVNYPSSYLERVEKLEQLKALENGIKIKVIHSSSYTWSVDTEEDLQRVISYLENKKDG